MLKRSFLQPLLIVQVSLVLTFLFFIFSQYYKPIFGFRIFCVDVLGILATSIIYQFIKPTCSSIIKRCLLIVFTYFIVYELVDNLIFYAKYHFFSRGYRTDFVEAETAVITFLITFILSGLVKMSEKGKSIRSTISQ